MEKDGVIIVNKDDFEYYELLDGHNVCTVSITDKTADIYSDNIKVTDNRLVFDIVDGASRFPEVKLNNIYAKHNVLIALYAYAAGKVGGMDKQKIIVGLEKYRQLGIRQNIFRTSDNVLIYADCYNAVARSMKAAINSAEIIPLKDSSKNRRIAVLGDVEEAGELSELMHKEIVQYVSDSCFHYLITSGKKLKAACHNMNTRSDLKIILCDDNNHVVYELNKLAPCDGDIVLFKSSHSGHLEKVMLSVFPETQLLINEEREKEIAWRKKIAIS